MRPGIDCARLSRSLRQGPGKDSVPRSDGQEAGEGQVGPQAGPASAASWQVVLGSPQLCPQDSQWFQLLLMLRTPIAGDPRTFGSGKAVCSALSRSAPLHARYAAAGASGERTLKPGNTPTPHPPPPPCGWERCLLASVLRLFIPLRLPCSISHYQQNVVSKTGQPS